jgi:regulator of CtrA degradation
MSDAAPINPFVEKTYQDTYELLVSIRDYISGSMKDEAEVLEAPDQLRLTRELSAMTRDLTDAMAWLMLQKAIEAGELSQEDANAEPAGNLGDKTDDADEVEDAEGLARLPITVRSLIDRSRRTCSLVRQLATDSRKSGT